MAECLAQVKGAMGSDAVILHTRTVQRRQWLGLRSREVVEITAGAGLPLPQRPVRRPQPARAAPATTQRAAAGVLAGQTRTLLDTPAASNAMLLNLSQEMTTIRSMVKDLVTQTRAKQCPQIPEDLFDHYMQLISNQVAEEIATDIVKTLQRELRPEHFSNPQVVRGKLAELLEKLLPAASPIARRKKAGPHVVALIGPTGVGKTTTLAKLAATLKLKEKHRVGLITIDTYRIAAIDQLKKYADIIGSPLRVVNTPEDLRDAIAAMADCEFILIDTAGRSPNDTLKLNELRHFIAAADPDEVHLVLSSTASQPCVELAIERFGAIRADKIIFTKLDEAAHVGVLLNVVRKVNKSLSYITTGQDVPHDIEECRGQRLAQLILGASL